MPSPPFDMNVQNNFPIASVIQAAQENQNRQLEAQKYGQQTLISGLQSIGQVGQSLLDRRRAMAQAMAGGQLYTNTPEGKEMLGTNQVTSASGRPVTMQNTAQGGVGQAPVPNPPAIDLKTLATAFMGDKPSDVMSQMFERHKLKVQSGLEEQKIVQEGQIKNLLASLTAREVGIKGQVAATEETKTKQEDINTLLQRRQEASANLPTGWWNAINNDKAEQAKQTIADIDRQLAAKGYQGAIAPPSAQANPSSQSQQKTPRFGATYTVNTSGQP
jgi:hypothetical protein